MARYYLAWVLLWNFFPSMAQEQSLLSTAGGFSQTSEFSIAWSVGETATETFNSGNYTITQGFQQGKLEPVGITDPKAPFTANIEVFPNPTQGLVYFTINKEPGISPILPDHYTLFNIQGKLLEQGKIQEVKTILDLSLYTGAVYYLRVYNLKSSAQSTVIIQKIK